MKPAPDQKPLSTWEKALAASSESVPGQEAPRWYGKKEYNAELERLWKSIVAGNGDGVQKAHSILSSFAQDSLPGTTMKQHGEQAVSQLSHYELVDMARKQEEIAKFTKAGPVELDNPLFNGIWLPYASHFAQHSPHGRDDTSGNDVRTYSRALRDVAIQDYAWAIPSNEAVSTILSYGRNIVEIGPGHGYWASLLAAAGGSVVAVDDGQYDYKPVYFPETVNQDGAEYLREHGGAEHATLFICWGGHSYKPFDDALAAFKGKYLAVVGEDADRCTWWPEQHPYLKDGNDLDGASRCINIFSRLGHQDGKEVLAAAQLYEQWKRIQTIEIPQWQSLYDHLAIFQRK